MSQQSIEIIRHAYTEPDWLTTLAAHIAPDAEFDFTAVYPDQPVMHGIDEIRRFLSEGPWESLQFEAEQFFDVDDERVLVFVKVRGTGRQSGVPAEARAAHEFNLRDGLLVRFKAYIDRDAALEAAGLRKQAES